jgi:hypothetical protein
MTRSGCIGVCAGLALSLFALGCGSSTSESGTGGSGGGGSSGSWEMARIGNPGTGWWMNAVKGKFFLSIKLKNSYAEDVAGRSETVAITKLSAGKSGTGALALVPSASELPGSWANDSDVGYTADGPVLATDFAKATEFIDGGADPFYDQSKTYKAAAFAWANFKESDPSKDSPYGLDLRVWEMASAANAKSLYADLLSNSLYSPDNVPWKECTGDACP